MAKHAAIAQLSSRPPNRSGGAVAPLLAEPAHEDVLLGLVSALLISLIWVQVFVGLSPDIYWDVIPTVGQPLPPITVLGPAGMAWLNSSLLIVSTIAMAIHVRRGGHVVWWMILLAMIGVVGLWLGETMRVSMIGSGWVGGIGGIGGVGGIGGGWREGGWVASVMAGVAVYHLAQHAAVRRLFVAVSLGAIVPLTLANLWYVLVDHPDTVRFYLDHESQTLIDRGWQAGSPQHLAYRRRLMSPDAVGFIGLSNVQGSILAALAALALGQVIERWRSGWRDKSLSLLLLLFALLGLALTRSRGAMMALAMVLVTIPILMFWRPLAKYPRRFSAAAMLLVFTVIAVVIGRGLMGPPETAAGERSLLFRFHYWQAAWRMVLDGDAFRWLFGVGSAENFKELYAFYKSPLNPEEVLSTHHVAIDFVTLLGVGGLAWVLLLAIGLWQSGRMPPKKTRALSDSSKPAMFGLWPVLIATGLVMLPSYGLRMAEMWWGTALLWLAGAVGMGVAACFSISASRTNDHEPSPARMPGWMNAGGDMGGYAAALVLMIHSQIEMTFFQPGACAVAWMIVALAASSFLAGDRESSGEIESRNRWRWLAAAMMGVVASVSVIAGVMVTIRQQTLGDAAMAMSKGDVPTAIEQLERAAAMVPADVRIDRQAAELRFRLVQEAYQRNDLQEVNRPLELVRRTIDRAHAGGRNHSSLDRMLAQTYDWQAICAKEGGETGEAKKQAMNRWGQIAARRPHDFSVWLSLAQASERAGDVPKALMAYRRVLEISMHSYLDPLMQLSSDQQRAIGQRIERLEASVAPNARP